MAGSCKTIAIYGGGIGGALLARRLSKDFNVTLIDPLDYFEVPMSVPRSLVDPEFAEPAMIPFAVALPNVTRVRARLVEWTANGGRIADADGLRSLVRADVSVLATGSRFSSSLMRSEGETMDERKAFYRRFHARLLAADRILIVGGGPIGIEVAGEISEAFPQKRVTVIEAGARILGGTSLRLSEHARGVLAARGVTIVTDERLADGAAPLHETFAPAGEALTNRGRSIRYDLLISCIGGRPNTDFMRSQFGHLLDSMGRIRVDGHLRVADEDRVFALGDITDLAENKMAWHIHGQVIVAESNIRAVLSGRAGPLKVYRPKTNVPTMVVTLGSREGVAHLPVLGLVTTPWVNRMAKSAHMLVPKFRKALGLVQG
ncbi:NADH dehydrogenase FAD-containing subunit [Paraburkholderia sp. MM5496-R1]|uniref:NAD(P)/FAD-dependent oxidoreductase n=1 Tax=Paraburkholderia sp. MM5496-R1 TaxID=2991065 RepID=UPI003D1D6326